VTLVVHFNDLDRDVPLLDSEQLEIPLLDSEQLESPIIAFRCYCAPVYLDGKILSIVLPTHFAITDAEKVFLPQLSLIGICTRLTFHHKAHMFFRLQDLLNGNENL
jgi:hypothetical protein